MMKSKNDHTAPLVSILVLVLCLPVNTLAQNGDEQENGQYLEGELYKRAVNLAVEEFNRAVDLGSDAQEVQPPSNRKSYYNRMHEALDVAIQLFDAMKEKPDVYQRIPDLLTRLWAAEYNAGVQILTDDDVRQAIENPDETAKAHLENAILIQPDSAISYVALSTLLLENEDTTGAISAYEQAIERMEQPGAGDYDELLNLYFTQDRFEEVIELSGVAREDYPEEEAFTQYLADAYLQVGESKSVMHLLHELIDNNPENSYYYFILGNLSYQSALQKLDEARETNEQIGRLQRQAQEMEESKREELQGQVDSLLTVADEKEREGEELMESAIEGLKKTGELDPENEEVFQMLGMIYQNRAVELFEKRDHAEGSNQIMAYDERARATLSEAMENYEKTVRLSPDNMEYWEVLHQIYSELGLIEKAEQAMDELGY